MRPKEMSAMMNAYRMGMVVRLCPPAELMNIALEIAEKILKLKGERFTSVENFGIVAEKNASQPSRKFFCTIPNHMSFTSMPIPSGDRLARHQVLIERPQIMGCQQHACRNLL
jgi:hypothetical protein